MCFLAAPLIAGVAANLLAGGRLDPLRYDSDPLTFYETLWRWPFSRSHGFRRILSNGVPRAANPPLCALLNLTGLMGSPSNWSIA